MANSSDSYFLAYYDGRIVNGHDNGVFHQMNAGHLTVAGTLETTAIYGSPNGNQGWTFEAWKDTLIHQKMCAVGKSLLLQVGGTQSLLVTDALTLHREATL